MQTDCTKTAERIDFQFGADSWGADRRNSYWMKIPISAQREGGGVRHGLCQITLATLWVLGYSQVDIVTLCTTTALWNVKLRTTSALWNADIVH